MKSRLKTNSLIPITEDSSWCNTAFLQLITTWNRCEEFIHQNQAVLACHEFFIGFIFIKHIIRTFHMRTEDPNLTTESFRFCMKAILASTLLVFKFGNYTHLTHPFPFILGIALPPFLDCFFLNSMFSLLLESLATVELLLIPYILTFIVFPTFQQSFHGLKCLSVNVADIPESVAHFTGNHFPRLVFKITLM